MFDGNKIGLHILSNSVFPHLNMTKTLGCATLRPVKTGAIIIMNDIGIRHENMFHLQEV
jgi:hypothetical protein